MTRKLISFIAVLGIILASFAPGTGAIGVYAADADRNSSAGTITEADRNSSAGQLPEQTAIHSQR